MIVKRRVKKTDKEGIKKHKQVRVLEVEQRMSKRRIYSFLLSRLTFKSDTIKSIKLHPCQKKTKTSEAPH